MYKNLLIIYCFLFSSIINAQNKSIGTWELHLPLGSSNSIAVSDQFVYSSTGQAIVKYDKNNQSIDVLDKTNGLSETSISQIAFDKITSSLLVLYTSSAIDIINENEHSIYTINDIKNKTISGSKSLNNIFFDNGLAYISTGFSVQVLDLGKKEFKEAYFIGNAGGNVKCKDVCIYKNKIYVSTSEGLKYITKDNPGILNFVNWRNVNLSGVIPNQEPQFIEVFDNKLFLIQNDTIYINNDTIWSKIGSEKYWKTQEMSISNDELIITQWKDSAGVFLGNRLLQYTVSSGWTTLINDVYSRPVQTIPVGNQTYYIADNWVGLVQLNNLAPKIISGNSPNKNNAFSLTIEDSRVYVAAGSYDGAFNYTFNPNGYFIYADRWWTSYNYSNTPVLNNVYDIVSITPDTKRNKIYYSSLLNGLIVSDATSSILYDNSNSILELAIGDGRSRVSDVKIDQEGNAIILNAGSPNPLKAIGTDGNWHVINGTPGVLNLKKMIIDQNDQLWISVYKGTSLMVVNKGDITTTTDDKSITFSTSIGSGGLPNESVYTMVEDLEGDIWVGTGAGIAVFYCASSIINNPCDAQRILVQRDGYNEYLFEKQFVKAIAVDGANRKWIGTTNGVWLISADGKKELLHFNVSNSPLPSNEIYDIAIDQKTGEVYFATDAGLVSYQGDATLGGEEHTDVLVYPNPVRPEYVGPIAIKGLVNDANIKITDIGGGLIWQGKANGGQAIWDGKNYNGVKAKTGIYLVFSLSNDGKEHYCAKIAFIN